MKQLAWTGGRFCTRLLVPFSIIVFISLLAVSMAPAAGTSTKYISTSGTGGDCSSIGVWDQYSKTCTLTSDLTFTGSNGIIISSDGVTLDGGGHSITDTGGYTTGGAMSIRTGVTIRNLTIRNFGTGILVQASKNTTITGNTLENNTTGISVSISTASSIYNNNFVNNATQATVSGGSGNVFSKDTAGGNYWSSFDTPGEGCSDNNGDFFCDAAYAFTGGQDTQAYTSAGGWDLVHPPDSAPPEILSVEPAGTIDSGSATVKVYYRDTGSNINLASVAVYLDGNLLGGCAATQESAGCAVHGMALGAHSISGSVADNRGNTSTFSGAFTFTDNLAPVVSGIQPSGMIDSGSAGISAYFSDGDGSGIASATAAVYLDGARLAGCTGSAAAVSCSASGLADGSHTIAVYVDDISGNHGSGSGSFTVDKTAPTVSSVQPSGTVASSSQTVSAVFSDAGSGIDTASVSVYLDGARINACSADASGVSCGVSGLATGPHVISGSVSDGAGNSSPIGGSFDFVDGIAPVISNILPTGTINTASTVVYADFTDGAGSGIDLASVAVYVDGGRLSGCSITAASAACGVYGLANGSHSIFAQADDLAGNHGSASGSFTVDTSSPPVSPTRYIRNNATGGDCTAIGVWDQYSRTCTLTTDLNFTKNGISIVDNGITLDGNGHTISGADAFTMGWSLQVKSNVTVRNLTIENFGYGIYLQAASHNTITGNTISGNNYGLYLSASSDNYIYHNNFEGNTTQAFITGGSGNSLDLPSPTGGNYWSNYDTPSEGCINTDGDYFCDAALAVYGGADHLPWTARNGWSGGSQPQSTGKPSLSLSLPRPRWSSYADYLAHTLTVDWSLANAGANIAYAVQITASINSNGVTMTTPLPVPAGDIASGSSALLTLEYNVPSGVGSWRSTLYASALDGAGNAYTYP
ncbi:MAG: NosD domain-containing protein [Thermoleophilia bacterium]